MEMTKIQTIRTLNIKLKDLILILQDILSIKILSKIFTNQILLLTMDLSETCLDSLDCLDIFLSCKLYIEI